MESDNVLQVYQRAADDVIADERTAVRWHVLEVGTWAIDPGPTWSVARILDQLGNYLDGERAQRVPGRGCTSEP